MKRLYVQMLSNKIGVALRGGVPPLVLHKGLVGTQVGDHFAAADGTTGNQFCRDTHILLLRNHLFDNLLIIVRLLVTWFCTLQQAVIALRVEQTLLIKPCLLEQVVHIGGDDEIVLDRKSVV